ncbi:hypothetical protein [Solobacterium moorei]|uniref:hypothetical protein n=1 Tax=Solobacterium moorei TaxID=102148 RepID=UPI0004030D1B|nr:hypothetical protein [Solobacterium moorei]BET21223.1 hypothetical protein RGT18_08110 [Solobacterium moorei]
MMGYRENKIFTTIGASNHSEKERHKDDYYATDPKAVELLLENETFNHSIWECACGEGHIAKVLESNGYHVVSTDLIDRGYGVGGIDFLKQTKNMRGNTGDIITNPPYKLALEFTQHALEIVEEGNKVAMFLKLTFLEGQKRKQFFLKYPPKRIYVFSKRITCAMNGEFENYPSSAIAYAWFVWEKGYKGKPTIDWIN